MKYALRFTLLIATFGYLTLSLGHSQTFDTLYEKSYEFNLNGDNFADDGCNYRFGQTTNNKTDGNQSLHYRSSKAKSGCVAVYQPYTFNINKITPFDSFFIKADFYKSIALSTSAPNGIGEVMTLSMRAETFGRRRPNLLLEIFKRHVDSGRKTAPGWQTMYTDTISGKSIKEATSSDAFFVEHAAQSAKGGADMYMDDIKLIRFRYVKPLIILESPNGGEQIGDAEGFTIVWDNTDTVDEVNIAFSDDGGNSWNTVKKQVPADSGKYEWDVSGNYTQQGLIRVRSTNDPSVQDISETSFSIFEQETTISITSPTKSEELPIARNFEIQWNSIKVDQVDIAFRDSTGWNTIANNIEASKREYDWLVPNAATPVDIRILDASSKNFGDTVSGIDLEPGLNKQIAFKSPKDKDTLIVGDTTTIDWVANDNVEQVTLKFKPSRDSNWTLIALDLNAQESSYKWTPQKEFTNASIGGFTTVGENSVLAAQADSLSGLEKSNQSAIGAKNRSSPSIAIFPNPAEHHLRVKLPADLHKDPFQLKVTDLAGHMYPVNPKAQGDRTLNIHLRDLPKGIYFLSIKGQSNTYVKQFVKQ